MNSTTHSSDFKSNWEGSGSYNLIKTVGLFGLETSSKILLAITKLLLLKLM
jgi:hypothetical protein